MSDWQIPLFKIYWDEDDVKAVRDVVERGMFWAAGPQIQELERMAADYVGSKYVLAFNNGTSALHAILMSYGIGPGDEVIVPSFTFIATVNASLFVGATPVFADIEDRTYGLDPESVRKAITPKTRAIIPVHYGGHPCLVEQLRAVADEHNILLIEDAAESFGAAWNGRQVGTFGDASMFSLCQTKVFTTGEGGLAVTDSRDIFEQLKLLRSHGRAETSDYFSSTEFMDYITLGYNFRMSTMTAALGISQLKKVDTLIRKRQQHADYLTKALAGIDGITIPLTLPEATNVYQEFRIRVNQGKAQRDRLQAHLLKRGIQTRVSFHPIHLTHYYRNVLGYTVSLPVTERLSSRALTLPLYPSLTTPELDAIAAGVRIFFEENS